MAEKEAEEDSIINQTSRLLSSKLIISVKPNQDGKRPSNFNIAVAKLFSKKPVGCNMLRRVFDGVWRVGGRWWVDELKPGFFKFTFAHADDLLMVLRLNPWTVNSVQLHFCFWPLNATLEEIDFSTIDYWIQAYGFLSD